MNKIPPAQLSPAQAAPGPARPVPAVTPRRLPAPISYQVENDFSWDEVLAVAVPTPDCVIVNVPRSLKRRMIYLWLFPTTALTDYAVTGDISFYISGQKIGSLPVAVALSKTTGGSIVPVICPSVFSTSAATSTNNVVTIFPSNPTTAGTQIVMLQPLAIEATCDEIRLSLRSFTAGTISVRAWLGCLSIGRSQQQNAS